MWKGKHKKLFATVYIIMIIFAISSTVYAQNVNEPLMDQGETNYANINAYKRLAWPIDCVPGITCSGEIGYPDIDGDGKAFNCGLPGYRGHTGTDIGITWEEMDNGVDVVAAEDGEVLWIFDGKYDRCNWPNSTEPDCKDPTIPMSPGVSSGYMVCTERGNYCGVGNCCCFWCFSGGNVVVILHHNEPTVFATRYDHLKKNSIRVSKGEFVQKGQKIAEVGSAGRSTGPHLHFEIWGTGFYEPSDPWAGPCGPNFNNSLWQFEPPWMAPVIEVSPQFVDFSSVEVGNSLSQRIIVSNTGIADLLIGRIRITGKNTASFTIQNDLTSNQIIGPSDSKTLEVVFSPASIGAKRASLSIPSNDINGLISIPLRGVGLSPVVLLTPNGGEVIPSGSLYPISWRAPSQAEKFKLMLSMDNGLTWSKVAENLTGTTYDWPVTVTNGNIKRCLLKVVGYDSSGTKVGADSSDSPFTIQTVTLTSPNEGGTFNPGDLVLIAWTINETRKPITKVLLYYTKNAGSTWNLIDTLSGSYPPGDYHQDWTVPPAGTFAKTKCKVKVVLRDAKGVTRGKDMSDNYFTISP